PGRYNLTFAVTAGDASDLLIGTLNIPAAPAPADQHNSLWDHIAPELPQFPPIPTWLPASAVVLTLLLAVLAFTSSGAMRRSGLVLASIAGMSSVALAAAMLVNGGTGGAIFAGTAILDLPDTARRSEDGAVFVPKATQRLLDVATVRTATAGAAQKTVRLIGQVIPDPNKSGLVQALLAGRIEAPESGFPAIGSRVKAGDILGYLLPSWSIKAISGKRLVILTAKSRSPKRNCAASNRCQATLSPQVRSSMLALSLTRCASDAQRLNQQLSGKR
nr:hypothetical protein [Hyphomicrobium sp.]